MIGTFARSWIKGREDRRPLFERLMSDSYRQAYHTALRLTGNAAEAEDLLQETFVRAYRFFHRYDDSLPFTAWMHRIMTNIHIDSARRRSRLKTVSLDSQGPEDSKTWEVPDESGSPDAGMVASSIGDHLQAGLRAMNPEFRTAVVLADIEGLGYEEIAEVMQTSVGTVRSRIHRGRKQLRSFIEKTGEGVAR
ncbi:MAG: sigma-70 family RNA polymerase sigma factor [Fimbriimonadaceae bacterium]|nr:sigma-70 family RNA polymerase sigma factor [Fimbriimonadaceae bacterium]QYK58406.1 MAG: sigma-70 family RNA polymerase sigma factor [Fimbriimonadaceae bacterium]